MTRLVKAEFNNSVIDFTSEGWFNATAVGGRYGKRPADWLALDSTKEYLSDLEEEIKSEDSSPFNKINLLRTKKGSPENGGGTWFHPDLAVPYARWLNSKFGIWCDRQIKRILAAKPDWELIRDKTKVGQEWMMKTLKETREAQGKLTEKHHYINENRLINLVLAGQTKLVRDQLSAADLELMAQMQRLNALMISQNLPYHERKAALTNRHLKQIA